MNRNIRRFAAALSLTFVLASSPVLAAPNRGGADRDGTTIVKIVKKLARLIGIGATAEPSGPPPSPSVNDKP
jgi:hypothetical protein